MPSHLSDGARRLIAKMLITNSEERATIPQIFDDPWFKVDLPDYLTPSGAVQLAPPKGRETQSQLDENIVTKVAEVRRNNKAALTVIESRILLRRRHRLPLSTPRQFSEESILSHCGSCGNP